MPVPRSNSGLAPLTSIAGAASSTRAQRTFSAESDGFHLNSSCAGITDGVRLHRRSESSLGISPLEISSDAVAEEEEELLAAREVEQLDLINLKKELYPPWLFGHPRGLYVLAATEVWERFGFYGMRSLLILYMTQELFLPENRLRVWGLAWFSGKMEELDSASGPQILASRMYGMYTCVAYLTPMAGGFLADQYLGRRLTVALGAGLMSCGYLMLGTVPAAFLPALGLIALGSGALKPNVSSQIGAMYDSLDNRKSQAFLIFYCSINLGAFLSPLVSGILHHTLGFGAGFLASSAAVLLGLVQYLLGLRHVPLDRTEDDPHKCSLSDDGKEGLDDTRWKKTFPQRLYVHRIRLLAILGICLLTVGFWGVYEQQGNTLPIFADQDVEMSMGSLRIPTEFVQSINPFLIICFTPLISAFWRWQARHSREPTSLTKMCLGCLILSLGYTWLSFAVSTTPPGNKVGLGHLTMGISLGTIGELYLAPVGLSFVSETAPEELAAFVMGMWFIAASIGFYVCGALGTLYSLLPRAGFFSMLATIAAINGGILFLAKGFLQRALLAS